MPALTASDDDVESIVEGTSSNPIAVDNGWKKKTARKSHGVVSEVPLWMGDVRSLGAVGGWGGIFQQRSSKSSLVKFLLSTKIQNSPP